jgi:hypothetical protein
VTAWYAGVSAQASSGVSAATANTPPPSMRLHAVHTGFSFELIVISVRRLNRQGVTNGSFRQ